MTTPFCLYQTNCSFSLSLDLQNQIGIKNTEQLSCEYTCFSSHFPDFFPLFIFQYHSLILFIFLFFRDNQQLAIFYAQSLRPKSVSQCEQLFQAQQFLGITLAKCWKQMVKDFVWYTAESIQCDLSFFIVATPESKFLLKARNTCNQMVNNCNN